MAKERDNQDQAAVGEQQRGTLNLRYEQTATAYANIAVLTSTPEEVVLNFGTNITPPTAQREVNAEISNRIIMTYPSAKRLAVTLGNLIKRYEARNGLIDVTPRGIASTGAPGAEAEPNT
jgi:hypothetical protein